MRSPRTTPAHNGPRLSRRGFLARLGAGTAGCLLARTVAGKAAPDPSTLREADYYESRANGIVRCQLCPRGCVVREGQRGYCRVRENRGGRYYSLVYGRPCSQLTDPIEKKPFFHVLPGSRSFSIATVGCNLACKFCQNWDISQAAPEDVPVPYVSPETIAERAAATDARTLAFTYTEPTVFYEYMADCARAGAARGLGSVVVTNGFMSAEPLARLLPLVKAIKVDLKAFTESFYREVCGGQFEPVRNTLRQAARSGVWLEIVVLLIPGLNDHPDETRRLAAWVAAELGPDVPIHFSRYHPSYKIRNVPPTPATTLRRARAAALAEGCRFVYTGNLPGEQGQDTLCPACGAMLVRRYQYQILGNTIVRGTCRACGQAVPGVWE